MGDPRLLQRDCDGRHRPEEEEVRASEIEKLVASVEDHSAALEREQRSAAALAKVESVKSQVTTTGLVRSKPETTCFWAPAPN